MNQKTKQITILNTYNQHISKPKVGQIVYLTSTEQFGSVPDTAGHSSESFSLRTQCPKTNQGIEREEGWLGDWLGHQYTSSHHAHGQWTVVSVTDKPLRPHEEYEGTEKFTVKLKKI